MQFQEGSHYIIVDGIIIHGNSGEAGIIPTTNSHHIRIMNGEIRNAKHGVLTNANSSAFEFIKLKIHNNESYGLYITSSSHLVQNCSIYQNAGWGVHIYSGGGNKPSNNRILNNKIYNNNVNGRGSGIGIYSGNQNSAINNLVWGNLDGIDINWGASQTKVLNNTIYKNRYGILLGDAGLNSTITNNIISSSTSLGLVIAKNAKNTQIKNNLIYGSGVSKELQNHSTTATLSKNLLGSSYNPKFQNVGGFDFRLQSGSPAIDAGLAIAEVKKDFVFTSRPKRAGYDIGAFEKP